MGRGFRLVCKSAQNVQNRFPALREKLCLHWKCSHHYHLENSNFYHIYHLNVSEIQFKRSHNILKSNFPEGACSQLFLEACHISVKWHDLKLYTHCCARFYICFEKSSCKATFFSVFNLKDCFLCDIIAVSFYDSNNLNTPICHVKQFLPVVAALHKKRLMSSWQSYLCVIPRSCFTSSSEPTIWICSLCIISFDLIECTQRCKLYSWAWALQLSFSYLAGMLCVTNKLVPLFESCFPVQIWKGNFVTLGAVDKGERLWLR